MIWAKQAKYRGVLFRSILEAKWANVFDFFEREWVYEPKSFSGYSPDFYLTQSNTFVEVKPKSGLCDRVKIQNVIRQKHNFLILDTEYPQCRAFPYAFHEGEEWTDMCWCESKKKPPNDFYVSTGAESWNNLHSAECPTCGDDHYFDGVDYKYRRQSAYKQFFPARQSPK